MSTVPRNFTDLGSATYAETGTGSRRKDCARPWLRFVDESGSRGGHAAHWRAGDVAAAGLDDPKTMVLFKNTIFCYCLFPLADLRTALVTRIGAATLTRLWMNDV